MAIASDYYWKTSIQNGGPQKENCLKLQDLTTTVGCLTIVVRRRAQTVHKLIHGQRHRLAGVLSGGAVMTVVAFAVHHVTKLRVACCLGLTTLVVTQVVVVALILKARQKVGHVIDAIPVRGRTTAVGSAGVAPRHTIRKDLDSSKVGKVVLVVAFFGVGVKLYHYETVGALAIVRE